jgi:hypothetical protein
MMISPKNPISRDKLRWVSKQEICLGSTIVSDRIGIDAVDTLTNYIKILEKMIR